MNVYEALEWALDCLTSDDEIIGAPEPGEAHTYTLNGVTMSRSTDYAANLDAARLAASPGARHDVPDLEDIARRVEGLRELAQRQGTWGIEYGDDRFCAAVLAMLRPPVLVPRDEPTREDIEGQPGGDG